jgi:hypothetical protein
MEFAQLCDRVEPDAMTVGPMDVSGLCGTWVNTNPDTNGIARLMISEAEGKVSLQALAIGPDGLIDWGATHVKLFASTPTSRLCAGFSCIYDFGFVEIYLEAMIMKGLIVLAQIHCFKDNSSRVDFFVREYFALVHGRY